MECKVWKKNLLPRTLNKTSRNGLNRRVKYLVAFNLISCNWVTVIMCTKIWVSADFKAKMSHITSLLAPHCSLVKIKMTFIPIASAFVAVICPGVLACLPSSFCLMLCVAGGSLRSVPAGRVGGVLTAGAVCEIQPAGSEKQRRGLRRLRRQVRNQLGQEPLVI